MPANKRSAPHRMLLLSLAAIPSLDCILNQLNNVFQISFGPLSLLQILRGYFVCALRRHLGLVSSEGA